MKTLIINNHTKHMAELEALFPGAHVVSHENCPDPQKLKAFDLLVISGGSGVPAVGDNQNYYALEERLVRESPIPILGICLGSELVVAAFGGELTGISTLHKGDMELHITDISLKNALRTNTINVYEAHRVRIKELPNVFTILAHSDHGIEIFKHETRPILGIQFHPEVGKHEDLWEWILDVLDIPA